MVQSRLQTAAAQAPAQVMAPRFEVDPTFPKPLPNGWYQGQSIGLWVDAQDHVWIVHRSDSLDAVEGAADQKTGECCKFGAARARVRSAGQPAAALGRAGRPRLSVARFEPRAEHRQQRQRLDRRQRRAGRAHPRVHAGRQVREAGRQEGRHARQPRDRSLLPGRQDVLLRAGERSLRRRRLRQPARRGDRRRQRQDEALLGRVRQQAGRCRRRRAGRRTIRR